MGNTFDRIFMEPYSSRKKLLSIKSTIQKGKASRVEISRKLAEDILDVIPSQISFQIKNNIAISTQDCDYIDNNIPISKLLCCEGLNSGHYVLISREQHELIAKLQLYTSTSMF